MAKYLVTTSEHDYRSPCVRFRRYRELILIGRASLAELFKYKVRIKVFPEQLTLFINTFVALK